MRSAPETAGAEQVMESVVRMTMVTAECYSMITVELVVRIWTTGPLTWVCVYRLIAA